MAAVERREVAVARAALAAVRGEVTPIGDEVAQLVADAAVGRAIREAAAAAPARPLVHVSWDDGRGGCGGAWLGVPLHRERVELADSAQELIDAAVGEMQRDAAPEGSCLMCMADDGSTVPATVVIDDEMPLCDQHADKLPRRPGDDREELPA